MQQAVNIVWLKRDLRLRDHAPLAAALATGRPCLLVYCFEPSLLAAPVSDVRHWRFVWESLQDLRRRLPPGSLLIAHAEVIQLLELLADGSRLAALYCYEEVGIKLTFDRDKAVKRWCGSRGIDYCEFPQNGSRRGLRRRDGWAEQVDAYFASPPLTPPLAQLRPPPAPPLGALGEDSLPEAFRRPDPAFQPGGETMAWRYADSFFRERSRQYSRLLSKPAASRQACSRLSPYLAFGCISARELMQYSRRQAGDDWNLNNFRSRVYWRSHYIQKLESHWRIEQQPINSAFAALDRLQGGPLLEAWQAGRTGFPMVDASMRCLQATGWINFRMRAMLVTFASFALWLDWRPLATHLARLFLDFDPGIHYPQIQMQAALTGYHTLRIFNPTVQVVEHDAEGIFIKKWLPELQQLPPGLLAEPWKMTEMEQTFYGCVIGRDYPAPVVDYEQATAANKARYWQLRQSPAAKAQLPLIWERFCLPADVRKYEK